ncbi:MAG: NAD-binding protein, partial [Nanoarchaeota archaeon]|nr:NAD-binding protein [Nanoarchaeota archaeon]
SEFGIIIVAGGVLAGAITKEISSLAIIMVIITMILSSYYIKYDDIIFKFCEPYLRFIDRKVFPSKQVKVQSLDPGCNMLFFGYYDLGPDLYARLQDTGKKIMVIDNDPENIGMLKRENIPYIFNSVNNPDFFENVSLHNIELAVSSLANVEDNKLIIRLVKKANPNAVVIVTAKNLRDSLELYNYRADYVLYPSYINHRQVSVLLEDYTTDINKVLSKKIEDVAKLKQIEQKRREVNKDLNKLWDMDSFFTNIVEKKKKLKTQMKPKKLMKRSYKELGKLWDLDVFFKRMTERENEKKEADERRLELKK